LDEAENRLFSGFVNGKLKTSIQGQIKIQTACVHLLRMTWRRLIV